jgi:hypothetical protein
MMNRNYAAFMVLGALISGVATFWYFKNRQEIAPEQEEKTVELYDRHGNVETVKCGDVVGINQYKRLTRNYNSPVSLVEVEFNDKKPYVISFLDFCEGNDKQDKVTLSYYLDGVLIEEPDGEMVDDRIGMIGADALDRFGELSDDSDVVYVRNEKLGIDFEIVKVDTPYTEGMGE